MGSLSDIFSHYSAGSVRFIEWLIDKYEQNKDSTKVWLMGVLYEVLRSGTVHMSSLAQVKSPHYFQLPFEQVGKFLSFQFFAMSI